MNSAIDAWFVRTLEVLNEQYSHKVAASPLGHPKLVHLKNHTHNQEEYHGSNRFSFSTENRSQGVHPKGSIVSLAIKPESEGRNLIRYPVETTKGIETQTTFIVRK